MPVIAVIPARYGSTRLPAKALADIDGMPMVVRVWRQVSMARSIERVIVATDDERIAAPVRAAGGEAMMTSPRIRAAPIVSRKSRGKVHADIYINVQGDQPFTDPRDLDAVAAPMLNDATIDMATLATPITDLEEFRNPTKVKVVCDGSGNALYFSRSPIPYPRDVEGVPAGALRHIGIYAYRRDFLLKFASMAPGKLEQLEKLEQLRALENGYRIRVVASVSPSLEIDTAEDLARARRSQTGLQ